MSPDVATSTQPASPAKLAGEKIGIEANLPIDRATGAFNMQIRNSRRHRRHRRRVGQAQLRPWPLDEPC